MIILTINIIYIVPRLYKAKINQYVDISHIINKLNIDIENYQTKNIDLELFKPNLTKLEYDILFAQTGLSKSSIDIFHLKYNYDYLKYYQDDYLNNRDFYLDPFIYGSYQETLYEAHLPFVDVRDGDILVTSSSFTYGFRHGHSGIVIDGAKEITVEAYYAFNPSEYSSVSTWLIFPNVMLLRIKEEYQDKINDIIQYANKNLVDVKYDLFASTNDLLT